MTPRLAAGDWGTSAFRLWLLAEDGTVLAERRSDEGLMAARAAGGFETVLERHLSALGAPADLPVLLCGMVGARSGWVEAAYLDAPLALASIGAHATPAPDLRRPVRILPGIAQRDPARPDVMRGEETKLLGLDLADGLVVMPGTHGKWVRLSGGRLESFATFMTGEIFAHLSASQRSVLREALAEGEVTADDPAFRDAVAEAAAEPASILNRLFQLRAGWLLEQRERPANLARLSGLLLGLECAGARDLFGSAAQPVLVASGAAANRHAAALEIAGFGAPTRVDAEDAVRAGLLAAARTAFDEELAA